MGSLGTQGSCLGSAATDMTTVFPEGLTMNPDHVSFNPAPRPPQTVCLKR